MTRREMFDSTVPGMLAAMLGDAVPNSQGLAFITAQLFNYESTVYQPRRTPLLYQRLVPIDTSDGEAAAGRTYYIMDTRGETKEIARGSDDMPLVDVAGTNIYILFKTGGEGYSYDTEDLRQATALNFNRVALLPQAAFDVYERGLNEHALFGTSRWGKLGFKEGLFNSSQIAAVQNTTPVDTMTADQLLDLFLTPFDTIYGSTHNTSYVNTVAAPNYMISAAQRTLVTTTGTETVLSFIARTNKTTLETGEAVQFIGVRGLETAGAGGGPRMLFYEKTTANMVLPLPMPYRFLAPQVRNLTFVVPGEFKYGPIHWRYPMTAVYVDSPIDSQSVLPGIMEQKMKLGAGNGNGNGNDTGKRSLGTGNEVVDQIGSGREGEPAQHPHKEHEGKEKR